MRRAVKANHHMTRSLSVLDLAMFLMETPQRPFNVGPLVLLRPPKGFKGSFADELARRMLKRPIGPPFDRCLHFGAGMPSLVRAENMDAAAHVHRLTLGGADSFDALFARVCE